MARILASGDTALVVEFGDAIDREINDRVLALADRIEKAALPGVIEQVPTFRSLMVHYDPEVLLFDELASHVQGLLAGLKAQAHIERLWLLPTFYGGDLGPDLEDVAAATGLTPGEVIRIHAAETYHVYVVGFLPGWPYMGDLPERLALPRRENPRVKVPMGAVCIAQRMTGVYPLESPGGWHLLGSTPVRMFDKRRRNPVLLAPGDSVRFVPVTRAEYGRMEALAEKGALELAPQGGKQ